MKSRTSVGIISLVFMFAWSGCDREIYRSDLTPPSPPRGISTITGDNRIEIIWFANPEPDVAGYNVYASGSFNGRYDRIGSTAVPRFVDLGARNGVTYCYAVTVYDFDGNESAFSRDIVYDTPRPEGYGVVLHDYRWRPHTAGYDFSTYSVGLYNDQFTDIFYEYYAGRYYMNVWEDTDIQDMGYTSSLNAIGYAPHSGWSPTKDVNLVVGHTYVVWTWDNHYAKFRVVSLSPNAVVFDWAYQLQTGNPRLKSSVQGERGILRMGEGARSRRAME